mgnify:CR=1 FL=1
MQTIWRKQLSSKEGKEGHRLSKLVASLEQRRSCRRLSATHTYQPLDTEVKINSKGEIDCLLNAADVCKTLGLVGDGIGQAGGVRSPDGLLGAGIAIFGSRIKLSHLNPPDATSTVEVRLRTEKKQRAQKI